MPNIVFLFCISSCSRWQKGCDCRSEESDRVSNASLRKEIESGKVIKGRTSKNKEGKELARRESQESGGSAARNDVGQAGAMQRNRLEFYFNPVSLLRKI